MIESGEYIIENLDASRVELTAEEFGTLEDSLNGLTVYGHRGLGGFYTNLCS